MAVNKKETAKSILKFLSVAGLLAVTAVSPRFGVELMKIMAKESANQSGLTSKNKRKFYNAFYYLKKRGLIYMEYRGQQVYVSLTGKGKKKAGKYQIDDLSIKKPKKWDVKWRVLIFDIEDKQRIKREALRGKIKELGLYQLQKSVWVHPYDFKKEMAILKEFFGLTDQEFKVIEASKIENDELARKFFSLGRS